MTRIHEGVPTGPSSSDQCAPSSQDEVVQASPPLKRGVVATLHSDGASWTELTHALECVRASIAGDQPSAPERLLLAARAAELEAELRAHEECLVDATHALADLAGLLARVAVQDYGVALPDGKKNGIIP
jgi:hypothetical protein